MKVCKSIDNIDYVNPSMMANNTAVTIANYNMECVYTFYGSRERFPIPFMYSILSRIQLLILIFLPFIYVPTTAIVMIRLLT